MNRFLIGNGVSIITFIASIYVNTIINRRKNAIGWVIVNGVEGISYAILGIHGGMLGCFYASFRLGLMCCLHKEEKIVQPFWEGVLTSCPYLIFGILTYREGILAISYRVSVVGKKVIASMMNCSKTDYRTQTIYGGEHYKCDLPPQVIEMVYEVMDIVGNDFAGIDVFKDKEDKWYVSEINSSGGMAILSKLYGRELVLDILKYIKER